MKLWQVSQWGNKDEGPNGQDTNCIVRAPTLEIAVEIAQLHLKYLGWNDGQCDVAYLMGEDASTSTVAKIIVYDWRAHAHNHGRYESWHRDIDTNKWLTSKEMFGE